MWYYKNKEFDSSELDPKKTYGFVYCITNKETGKKYIGKKFFWFKKSKAIKNSTRKRRSLVESDWKKYYRSNKTLQEEASLNPDNYHREILHLCANKSECAYLEIYEQLIRNAILSDDYYNEFVGCRIRYSNSLKHLKNKDLQSL